jgi:ATP-dependent DNA helicase UvrD/PcrA
MVSFNKEQRYAEAEQERREHVEAVVRSPARKKIVVAGPGTGKTFLFKAVLRGKANSLTVSFVNSLIEDLSLELYGMSAVSTLHSFARALVGKAYGDAKVFPKLSMVIHEDAKILFDRDISFDKLFHERDDDNADVKFYSARRQYYDRFYGHTDIIFAATKYLERNPDKTPIYDQVLVDEFQDFNRLEVSLIDLLSEKSPVLIVGDDDQALYDFKSASTEHIRQRHGDENAEYASFTLPYCSRCTRVIVEAINDMIVGAARDGYLRGRVAKGYKYFECAAKDAESERHHKIMYGQYFSTQIPWFIETQIEKIAATEKTKFSVLVISPTGLQTRIIAEELRKKGFESVANVDRRDRDLNILDGLRLLMEDADSNLGWRIVAKFTTPAGTLGGLVRRSAEPNADRFSETIDAEIRVSVRNALKTLNGIANDTKVSDESLQAVCSLTGIYSHDATKQAVKEKLSHDARRIGNPATRRIPIRTTTIQSSKGLAEDYVFITHFDDQYLIRDKDAISDREICNFLVALTRARKKVFLVSSAKKRPTFLKWISADRVEGI